MASAKPNPSEIDADKKLAGVDPATGEIVDMSEYAEYAGDGFEGQTADDYALPFLHILQALSPILENREDLRPGMILNTVTGETVTGQKGIRFIPATTKHEYVEWRPRDQGGGYIGSHPIDSELVRKLTGGGRVTGALKTPDGNELIETFYVYGLIVDDEGGYSHAVISFESAKIKKYRAWMTKAKTIQIQVPGRGRVPAPLFSHVYRLRTVSEKNKKGTFFNWEASFDGENALACRLSPKDELFQAAAAVRTMLDAGTVKVDYAGSASGRSSEDYVDGEVAPGEKPVF